MRCCNLPDDFRSLFFEFDLLASYESLFIKECFIAVLILCNYINLWFEFSRCKYNRIPDASWNFLPQVKWRHDWVMVTRLGYCVEGSFQRLTVFWELWNSQKNNPSCYWIHEYENHDKGWNLTATTFCKCILYPIVYYQWIIGLNWIG